MSFPDVLRALQAPGAWQWLVLPALGVGALIAGRLLGGLSARVVRLLARRTPSAWDDALAERLPGPLSLLWTAGLGYAAKTWLSLAPRASIVAGRVLGITAMLALFWLLLRGVDIADQMVGQSRWTTNRQSSRSLMGLASRGLKAAIVVVGAIAALSQAGYAVTSLLAGVGLGGLALALAAQKTVENVFGAFSLAVDAPFNQGDFVKIDGVMGTVEAVGLRSTRIRTLDRTLVAIPNGKLAEMRVETFAARDRIRLACTVSVVYQTTSAQMRAVLAGLEAALREQPLLWPEGVTVRFSGLGASSLDIEIAAWFQTTDYGQFQLIRQDLLLQFMETIERAGTHLAYPTRTVHLASGSDAAGAGAEAGAEAEGR